MFKYNVDYYDKSKEEMVTTWIESPFLVIRHKDKRLTILEDSNNELILSTSSGDLTIKPKAANRIVIE